MRRYLVVRTDKSQKAFIQSELEQGRLRQGWGWKPEHDLRLVRARRDDGAEMSDELRSVWRNRRLLDTEPDGVQPGDLIIVPNVPDQGRWLMAGEDTISVQPEHERFQGFFSAVRDASWQALQQRYKGAELEQLVHRLMAAIYHGGRVEHWGGAGEKGADLIIYTSDPLGLEYRIGVQVKMHQGTHHDTHALDQLQLAHKVHRIDAGVIVTTAEQTSEPFELRRDALEADLGIDIKVIARDELTRLVMKYLSGDLMG